MNYKLIASDCDGTLLNSEGYIPPANINTLRKLNKMGVQILLVTGRNDILAKDYAEELGVSPIVIGCNGATISNVETNELSYLNSISPKSSKEVFDFCTQNHLPFKAITMHHCYTSDKTMYEKGISLIVTKYTKKLKYTLPYVLQDNMYQLINTKEIIKIVLVNEDTAFLKKVQQRLNLISGISAVRSAHNCIDIIAANVSKGNALKYYAEKLNINKDEIIALGDSENDKSMLEFAGIAIAMQNADPELKNIADIIADTNDHAGLSKVLIDIFKL